jgi:hypothetical protein
MWHGLPIYEDYILTQHYFSIRFHYSLLGYRSQQWIHLYSIFSRRYPGDKSPAWEVGWEGGREEGRKDALFITFITFICNPAWDDIQQLLLPGQSPVDRHDITARVFRQRLKSLMDMPFQFQRLSHSNAWPGTASNKIKWVNKLWEGIHPQ